MNIIEVEKITKKFKDFTEADKTYYNPFLGNIRIEIEKYDPSPDVNKVVKQWTIYDYPYTEERGEIAIKFPVLLRDVVDNSDYFGVISLMIYK